MAIVNAEEAAWVGQRVVIGGPHAWKGYFGTVVGFSTIEVLRERAAQILLDHGHKCNVFDLSLLRVVAGTQEPAKKEASRVE